MLSSVCVSTVHQAEPEIICHVHFARSVCTRSLHSWPKSSIMAAPTQWLSYMTCAINLTLLCCRRYRLATFAILRHTYSTRASWIDWLVDLLILTLLLSDVTAVLFCSVAWDEYTLGVPSWSCWSQAVSKPVWHIPLLYAQWKTRDDGQGNCPKHVEFYASNKFKKLVHLLGFIIRIYHGARPPERHKFEKLVHLVGFIIKMYHDARPPEHHKFEKLVHLVGFIIKMYHDARPPERHKFEKLVHLVGFIIGIYHDAR